MTSLDIQQSILDSVRQLSVSQQLKLLDFIQSLVGKQSEEPIGQKSFMAFAGAFEERDLAEMEKAIEFCLFYGSRKGHQEHEG